VVYLGRNDNTSNHCLKADETVAIKVIDLKGLVDQFARDMLQSEIQAIRTLSHPNILRCYDVFTTVNNCYIIMEFCDEGDLAANLHKKGKLSEE
jgi:serine/threonine-protein kinase ULK/ATG1